MTRPRRRLRRNRPKRVDPAAQARTDALREEIARRLARIREGLKNEAAPPRDPQLS